MTEYSCLGPHNALEGAVNLADYCIDRWQAIHPAINMFYFNPLKCLLSDLNTEYICFQAAVAIVSISELLRVLIDKSIQTQLLFHYIESNWFDA